MMWLINLLKKRPKDSTIRLLRIVLGIIYSGGLYYYLIYLGKTVDSNYFWFIEIPENSLIFVKYFFISLGIIPILFGIFNLCLFKKKIIRIMQIIFGFFLFYVSFKIEENANLGIPELLFLLGFLPLFAGITGKCITTKCIRFGEKIEKIRV